MLVLSHYLTQVIRVIVDHYTRLHSIRIVDTDSQAWYTTVQLD